MGKRNWLFASTEVGARRVGIIQSLLVTCRMHAVDPYTYLVDVLQRISEQSSQARPRTHPASVEVSLRSRPLAIRPRATTTTTHHTERQATSTPQIARLRVHRPWLFPGLAGVGARGTALD